MWVDFRLIIHSTQITSIDDKEKNSWENKAQKAKREAAWICQFGGKITVIQVKNKLIEMVLENGITAFRASKVLDIRPCTAKRIIRKHMQATEN